MPLLLLFRVLAVLGVVAAWSSVRSPMLRTSLVLTIAFGHYTLALFYSRRRVAEIAGRAVPLALLLLLVASAPLLYAVSFSVAAYFAVHHAFNEAYARAPGKREGEDSQLIPRASHVQRRRPHRRRRVQQLHQARQRIAQDEYQGSVRDQRQRHDQQYLCMPVRSGHRRALT